MGTVVGVVVLVLPSLLGIVYNYHQALLIR